MLDRTGNKAAAILDFTAAIDRDPRLIPAFVNRGLARLELKQYAPALDDFDRAQSSGVLDASVSAGRGIALENLGRHGEADAAFADCFARSEGLTASTRARLSWAYGFAISARDHDKALAAFNDALRHEPLDFQALYGRAMLAMSRGKNTEALRDFDRAIQAEPGRNEARRYPAPSPWLARGGGNAPPRRSTVAWSASPSRRRRSTRPPASWLERSTSPARP